MTQRWLIAGLVVLLLAPAAAVLLARSNDSPPSRVRVDRVTVADLPTDIAISQGRAWVTSAGSDEVVEVADRPRPGTGGRHSAGAGTLRVAADPLSVWVTGAEGDRLTSFDTVFGARAKRRGIPVHGDAVDVAIGPDAVWVTNGARGTVTRVDPVANRVVGPPIRTGRFPTALAVGAHDVWVVNSGDGTLSRVDQREDLVAGRRVAVGRDPQDVAIGFGSVWVANRGDGTLSRVSERTGRPQAKIKVGGAPTALAVTTEAMLVLDSAKADVVRVDPRSGRITDRVHLGGYPAALAVGDGGALWSVDARSGTVTRVSGAS